MKRCSAFWNSYIRGRKSSVRLHQRYVPLLTGLLGALTLSIGSVAYSADLPPKNYKIAAQSVSSALKAFAAQSDLQLIYTESDVGGANTSGITGTHPPKQALAELLTGTGLEFEFTANNVVVVRKTTATAVAAADKSDPPSGDSASLGSQDTKKEVGKNSSQEFRVAPVDQATSGSQVNHSAGQQTRVLQEVVVTAEKRQERLQDVPVPVTAIDANTLADTGQARLQDYFASVPGLNLNANAAGSGTQSLAIRGITTGHVTNPTVSIAIDDVPYGSSTTLGFSSVLFPDIDPSDLSRIEVLRGPQGTLYGASNIGGLIKFVTRDPSPTDFSGRVQILGNDVDHGGVGFGFRGAVNVPASDDFAVRASGFFRRDPGYIDNVLTGRDNVNSADVYGGRFAAIWHLSDSVSLKVSALLQNTEGNGSSMVDTNSLLQPILGDLRQARMPGTEGYSLTSRLYTATLMAKLGSVDFTSISGYQTNNFSQLVDASFVLADQYPFYVSGASSGNYYQTKKFSQEFRLTSSMGKSFDWLLGAFYTHENTSALQTYVANDRATGIPVGYLETSNFPSTVAEYAGFADLTWHFTDRFDTQFGGRESHNRQTYSETDAGPFVGPAPSVTPEEVSTENSFTYLVTPRFKIAPDEMLYARFASGYRVGGPNLTAAVNHLPLTYGPDKTNNYEVGFKGDFLNHNLAVDASVYHIDWRHIQLYVLEGFYAYFANAGDARSQGVELAVDSKPIQGLTVSAAASFNDAKLTQNFPETANAIGFSGDRLPYSSRFSGSLSANQDLQITGRVTGFLGATFAYVGDREGDFATPAAPKRVRFPGYAEIDLRAGTRFGGWTVDAFLNNLADRRGIIGGGVWYAEAPYYSSYIQPRTVGLSIAKAF